MSVLAITVFKRYEKKYLLTERQYDAIRLFLAEYMRYDQYCLDNRSYKLYNLYCDSPNNDLIRVSTDGPIYKEKLRIRSYFPLRQYDDKVFFEIKQKYNGVVTKRRATMKYGEAMEMTKSHKLPPSHAESGFFDRQVEKEILRMLIAYDLRPAVYIAYDRVAMFGKDDPELRITFDKEILTRRSNLVLDGDTSGVDVLPPGRILMEIKIPNTMPLWLARYLSENRIFNTSFSKYGKEYESYVTGDFLPAAEVKNV